MLRVPRVARGGERQIETRPANGELMRAEFAQYDGARGAEFADADGVLFRHVIDEDLRMARGRQTGHVDDVLDAHRNAVQRPARAARHQFRLGGPRRRHRALGVQADEGVQFRLQHLDAFQQRRHEIDRGQRAIGIGFRDGGGREPVRVGHSVVSPRMGGHGSAAGSVGKVEASVLSSACAAAAATSSGKAASALSRPAALASAAMMGSMRCHPKVVRVRSVPGIGGKGKRRVRRCVF